MSFGVVRTLPFTEVENTPQAGHAAAVSSSVTTSTTRLPSACANTPVTFTPGNPNNTVVLSITPLVLPTSECFATSRLQETKGFQPINALTTLKFQLARSRSKSRFGSVLVGEGALHNPGCRWGLKPPLSSSDLAM